MASRNRIHKSSVSRKRGPTRTHEAAGKKKAPKAEKWGEEAGMNTRFMQTGMEDDYTDPRPHNNYDDSDKTYPPAHRW